MRDDLRHALRSLIRQPQFTAIAVVSLALGIGGNSAIFAFVDGFVLHPFQFPDASRVVGIGVAFPRVAGMGETDFVEALSAAELRDIREARSLQHIAAFDFGNRTLNGGDRPERMATALTLSDPFATFGLRPHLGRGFAPNEPMRGNPTRCRVAPVS